MRFTRGQRYLGGFCGRLEEIEQWSCPKVKELSEIIDTLGKFAVRYMHISYVRLAMLLQAEWQYLMRTVLGFI